MDTEKLNGDNKIELLYHVAVDGKPVPAIIAANDMSFVKDEEVRKELGYPFLIKAERTYLIKLIVSYSVPKMKSMYCFFVSHIPKKTRKF